MQEMASRAEAVPFSENAIRKKQCPDPARDKRHSKTRGLVAPSRGLKCSKVDTRDAHAPSTEHRCKNRAPKGEHSVGNKYTQMTART